jgi:small subunit ribosomal protein S9
LAKTQYHAVGRRKRAMARVWLYPGKGTIRINHKDFRDYFRGHLNFEVAVKEPLIQTSTLDKYDVDANVRGGGIAGQAGAVRQGIARALVKADEGLRPILREKGFLTRDPRMHERKKYGQPGRRKKFQYSKR